MSGRDDDPRTGYPNGAGPEMPVDLAAVQADDALLDMLSGTHRAPDAHRSPRDIDGELTQLLVAWRGAVHTDSNRVLVDTDTALAMINAARRPARRRNPVFGTFAAAAAVLVIAFSSMGLVAKSAQPGDQLWPVTEVLFSEYARSVKAATFVQTELKEAETAIRTGNPGVAKAKLQRIQQQLPAIGEAEGRTDLAARHQNLEKLADLDPDAGTKAAEKPVKEGSPTDPSDSGSSKNSVAPPTPMPSTVPSTTSPSPTSSPSPTPSPTPEPPTPTSSPLPTPPPPPTPPPTPTPPPPPPTPGPELEGPP